MKKRILSILLAFCIWPALFPLAFAVNAGELPEGEEECLDAGTLARINTGNASYAVTGGKLYFNSIRPTGISELVGCDTEVTEADIPEYVQYGRVTSINYAAFEGCTALRNVTIPSGVTTIESLAFHNCYKLTGIRLPNGVTVIGPNAFRSSGLKNVALPNSITSIGTDAFRECTNLENIRLPNKLKKVSDRLFRMCSNLKSVTLSDGITSIGEEAFSSCQSLKSIKLPSSVTEIKQNAFSGCGSLRGIDIPRGVASIAYGTFQNCTSLASVTLPGSVTSLGNRAFSGCSGLRSIYLPNSITSIGSDAFSDCRSLREVTLPNGITSVSENAFFGCGALKTVRIPSSVTSIDTDAFKDCGGITDVYYGGSQEQWNDIYISYGNDALKNAVIHYSSLPDADIISAGKYALHVVDQDGEGLAGATVIWSDGGDHEEKTDQDGWVKFSLAPTAVPQISVFLNGYMSWTNAGSRWSQSPDHFETVVLYPKDLEGYRLTSCRYSSFANMAASTDLLTQTKTVSLGNTIPSVGNLDERIFYIECAAGETVDRYALLQNGWEVAESRDGRFTLSVDDFLEGGDCSILVQKDKKRIETPINLQFQVAIRQEPPSGFYLDGDSVQFRVPEGIPYVGDSMVKVDLPIDVPITYLRSDDTVQVGLNLNVAGGDTAEEQLKKAKDLMRCARRAGSLPIGKLSEQDEKIFKSLVSKTDSMKFFQDGEINLLGYLEFELGSSVAKGHVILKGEITAAKFGYTAWVVVAPVTAKVELGLEGGLAGEFTYDWENAIFLGNVDFEAAAKLTAFGGIGAGDFVGAGAYGSAELSGGFRFCGTPPTGLQSLELTGELGLKGYIGLVEYERPFAYNTWVLYAPNNTRALVMEGERWYDAGSYHLQDLSYLAGESEWQGGAIQLFDASASTTLTPLLEGTYRNASPVMVAGQNGLYAALLQADAEAGQVYTAITKWRGGSWTEPRRVDYDAVADSTPSLCVGDDGTIWLAYAKTAKNADCASLLSYAKNQTIVVGSIDSDNLTFNKAAEYQADGYAHLPSLSVVNGVPVLAWADSAVTEEESSVFWPSSSVLYTASCAGGTWSAREVAQNVNGPITQLVIGEKDGVPVLGYTVDESGGASPSEAQTLYCDGVLMSRNVQGRVTFGQVSGMSAPDFLWNGDGYLESASGTKISAAGISSEYVPLGDRLYYSAAGESGAHLTVVLYENGGWSVPITLTGGDRYLENLSVVSWNGDSYLLGMDTWAEITEDSVKDMKNLVWAAILPSSDLRLDDVGFEEEGLTPGEQIPITLYVTNAGDHTVTSIETFLNGEAGEVTPCSLKPGGSLEITRTVTCPDTVTQYTFSVIESGQNDFTPEDNECSVSAGYARLSVKLWEQRVGTSQTLCAVVRNDGIAATSGNVRFTNEDGITLEEASFEMLRAGDSAVILCPGNFPSGSYTANLLCDSDSIYEEWDSVFITNIEEPGNKIKNVAWTGRDVTAEISAAEQGTGYCAAYDANQKLLAAAESPFTAGTDSVSFKLPELPEAVSVKVFLLDANGCPLCCAREQSIE